VDDVHAACCAAEEQVFAVVEIQRHEIVLTLIAIVIERQVQIVPQPHTATKRGGAFGRMKKRYFGDFVLRVNRKRACSNQDKDSPNQDRANA
jgi:hypothetical protein